MKKLSDEAKAGIVCTIWLTVFYAAGMKNTAVSWTGFAFVTFILLLYVYFDWKNEKANKNAENSHKLFVKQTESFMRNVRGEQRGAENDV